jgi:hypothetical protein
LYNILKILADVVVTATYHLRRYQLKLLIKSHGTIYAFGAVCARYPFLQKPTNPNALFKKNLEIALIMGKDHVLEDQIKSRISKQHAPNITK